MIRASGKSQNFELPLMMYDVPFLLHRYASYLNLDHQKCGWILPTLTFPLITASATPDNPSWTSKSDPPSTSQTTCTVSTEGISVHNIVRHNRDIYLSKSPSVE